MILGIDIDDTIAGWIPAMQALLWKRYQFSFIDHLVSTSYLNRFTPDVVFNATKEIGVSEEFYVGLLPIPGAIEVIHELLPRCEDIHYVTHRQEASRGVSVHWLQKWGFPCASNIFMEMGSKHEVVEDNGITHYIDDRWESIYTLQHLGIHAYLLLAYPSNFQKYFPYSRHNGATTWRGIYDLIMKDLEIDSLIITDFINKDFEDGKRPHPAT